MSVSANISCRLCSGNAPHFLAGRVLHKFDIAYYRCAECELIQTEPPQWLEEAYSSAISALDTGAIHRNVFTARLTLATAFVLGLEPRERCLDFGGGYGVFTRLMRDAGWNFTWSDRYAQNLFARGFEGDPAMAHELVTAFEVFEHLVDVRAELSRLFAPNHRAVLVSTVLHDGKPAASWDFFVPEAGQHVAFFSAQTMQHIGRMFGYQVVAAPAHTLFVRRDVELPAWKHTLLTRLLRHPWLAYGCGTLLFEWRRPLSLMRADHTALRQQVKPTS